MGIMEKVPLPGTDAHLAIGEFTPDYRGRGPALLGVFLEKGKPHRMFRIFTKGATGSPAEDDFSFVLKDFKRYYYTGLRVTKNPGMPLVWYGFLLVLLGFILNLFFAHNRVWIRITPLEKGCEVSIAAGSNKRVEALEKKLDKISKKLGVE
jgi:cytochrome c biogenesis protein